MMHLFEIEDGETHVYAADHPLDALVSHLELYGFAEPPGGVDVGIDEVEITCLDPASEVTIVEVDEPGQPKTTKTAREWAAECDKVTMLSCSVY